MAARRDGLQAKISSLLGPGGRRRVCDRRCGGGRVLAGARVERPGGEWSSGGQEGRPAGRGVALMGSGDFSNRALRKARPKAGLHNLPASPIPRGRPRSPIRSWRKEAGWAPVTSPIAPWPIEWPVRGAIAPWGEMPSRAAGPTDLRDGAWNFRRWWNWQRACRRRHRTRGKKD